MLGAPEQRQCDEPVGRQQVERDRPIPLLRHNLPQGGMARPVQPVEPGALTSRGTDMIQHTIPENRRSPPRAGVEPFLQSGHLGRSSQDDTSAGTAWRAAPSRAGSPAPAEANCGRPPPLPPLTAAIRFTRSPAL